MAATLPAAVLRRYRRFTLYNSPYAAHDRGCAVDLYPCDPTHPDPEDGNPVDAPSPVAGEVLETRTVTAPAKPYAAAEDHLILVDTGAHVARILHVDPAVEAGDRVAVGDSLGTLVRAGFFAPWVANHLHLGFRERDANPYRAAGSLPLEIDPTLRMEPLAWDGTGTVVATGETYAVLDAPGHPDPGECFAGVAATEGGGDQYPDDGYRDGGSDGEPVGILDGGLPHYDGGGLLRPADAVTDVRVAGSRVGIADGRDVTWDDVTIFANGDPVQGIAFAIGRDEARVKLVGDAVELGVGTDVAVDVVRER